jgi:mono/diheme cytochrome c family protein
MSRSPKLSLRGRWPVILAALPALALGGCAVLGLGDDPPTAAERGLQVARVKCVACHAVEPGGGAGAAARAPAFASREMIHTASLGDRVAELTRKGHYGMPPVRLEPGEVADIVAYIESLEAGLRHQR